MCPECGRPDDFPWRHVGSCVTGLRAKNRLLTAVVPWMVLAVVAQGILLGWLFVVLGRLP